MDYWICGGTIIDGTGSPAYRGDVGIAAGRITAIRRKGISAGERGGAAVIDAVGAVISPGFIDMHSHSDLDGLTAPMAANKIAQGVTLEVAGNCGFSLFPVVPERKGYLLGLMESYGRTGEIPWSTAEEYFAVVRSRGLGFHYLPLVGHGVLRLNTLGASADPASGQSLKDMEALLAAAMDQGAWGFSSGLGYMPGCFASTEELIALAKVAAVRGGFYATHLRDQGDNLAESVEEALRIGRESGAGVIISHIKSYGRKNWGRLPAVLESIDRARGEGVKVLCDLYPYDSASSTLTYELPPWAKAGGPEETARRLSDPVERGKIAEEWRREGILDWDRVILCGAATDEGRALVGKTVARIGVDQGKSPEEAAMDLILQEGDAAGTLCSLLDEGDIEAAVKAPFSVVGSDAYAVATEQGFQGHPRNFGAFPRYLKRYVFEKKILSLEEGIRKITGLPAEFLGLEGRGVLAQGAWADVTVFRPEILADRATVEKPTIPPEGIEAVFVDGVLRFHEGQSLDAPAGKILLNQKG